MKTFITTAALVAALTSPAFAEGSEDTRGEAMGILKMSTISPSQDGPTDRNEIARGAMAQGAMAQARIVQRSATRGAGSASTASGSGGDTSGGAFGFSPGSSGADGGNRK